MRVAILSETYARNTGYFGAMFPKYLARLGVDVHLLTLDLPPYWNVPSMQAHYAALVGAEWLTAGKVGKVDGYAVHVMPHDTAFGFVRMRGMYAKLRELKVDIVYSLSAIGLIALQAALLKPILGYRLFTGSHTAASTFPLYHMNTRWWSRARLAVLFGRTLTGRLISLATETCLCPTVDCAEIAWRFFGVQRSKVGVLHLGVDTDVFYPVRDEQTRVERQRTRAELGLAAGDVAVIYTGKITREKNVTILVRAVARLQERGLPFRLVIIGDGPERRAVEEAGQSVILPYQPYDRLGRYYRACDIAVWPTNESTSMLDAAACGLPLVVSDLVVYREHVEGNGVVFRLNDLDDLVASLERLNDPDECRLLGSVGAAKMAAQFSWLEHARRRLTEYQARVATDSGSS